MASQAIEVIDVDVFSQESDRHCEDGMLGHAAFLSGCDPACPLGKSLLREVIFGLSCDAVCAVCRTPG